MTVATAVAAGLALLSVGLSGASAEELAPPATISVAVDSTGVVHMKTGWATIGGTFTCTNATEVVLYADLQQPRRGALGGSSVDLDASLCDGAAHRWSMQVHTDLDAGEYGPGAGTVYTFGIVCTDVGCAHESTEQQLKLRAAKP